MRPTRCNSMASNDMKEIGATKRKERVAFQYCHSLMSACVQSFLLYGICAGDLKYVYSVDMYVAPLFVPCAS